MHSEIIQRKEKMRGMSDIRITDHFSPVKLNVYTAML